MLGSCNPSKGWVYKNFYKKQKENKLQNNKIFIQALVTDNPDISKHYIENLKSLPKAQRDRLLLGLWESDDASALISYDNIINIFTNTFALPGKKYITCDVARLGSDKAVILYWDGWIIKDMKTFDLSLITDITDCITSMRNKYSVPLSNIIADVDGVGGGVVDILKINGFVNNAKALNNENYTNLKTQCYYMLAKAIDNNEIYFEYELTTTQEEEITEELEQIKSDISDSTSDSKLKMISKIDVKQAIGRSPDYTDAMMMRMYFELGVTNNGNYSFGFGG
jgi:ribosomal protein S8